MVEPDVRLAREAGPLPGSSRCYPAARLRVIGAAKSPPRPAVLVLSVLPSPNSLTQPSSPRNHSRVWRSFENGETLGTHGSADGLILLDEEHRLGARITLESGSGSGGGPNARPIPYAITCGIYGLFFHTCFFAHEAEARNAFGEMKIELDRILKLESHETAGGGQAENAVYAALSAFVDRFPT